MWRDRVKRMHLPSFSPKGISWCGGRGEWKGEDKSTAALPLFEAGGPAVCTERPCFLMSSPALKLETKKSFAIYTFKRSLEVGRNILILWGA